MSQDQLDLIINNSDWNEEKREWTVPNFVYKERMVNLPKYFEFANNAYK